jgi:hypothetical protein
MSKLLPVNLLVFVLLIMCTAKAADLTNDEADTWLEDDSEQRALSVNEGQLVFLKHPPGKPVHHHDNKLLITRKSLTDGWVSLHQCHENLDKVSLAEIVFNKDRIRDLKVESYKNIEKVWVDGSSVQLKNVGDAAKLCISAQSKALHIDGTGRYSLRNGPYMRKFLDGYYPLHVTIEVDYPATLLSFVSVEPKEQPGFQLRQSAGVLHIDAWFEGKLKTNIVFRSSRASEPN